MSEYVIIGSRSERIPPSRGEPSSFSLRSSAASSRDFEALAELKVPPVSYPLTPPPGSATAKATVPGASAAICCARCTRSGAG